MALTEGVKSHDPNMGGKGGPVHRQTIGGCKQTLGRLAKYRMLRGAPRPADSLAIGTTALEHLVASEVGPPNGGTNEQSTTFRCEHFDI